jgi:hypothetical protein
VETVLTVSNITFYFFVALFLSIMLFMVVPALVGAYRTRIPSNKKIKIKLPQLIQLFKDADNGPELGRGFVELLRIGFFQCLRTGNHGKDFPDEK